MEAALKKRGPAPSRERQEAWRAALPEVERLVTKVSPAIWEENAKDRRADVPEPWRALVATMRTEVAKKADDWAKEYPGEKLGHLRGRYWAWKVDRVGDMLLHLMDVIRQDIGMDDDGTLGSMILVREAMLGLNIELQDAGREQGHDAGEEYRFRVANALRSMVSHFDDVSLRRFRALRIAEFAAKDTRLPDDDIINEHVESLKDSEYPEDRTEERREKSRKWMTIDRPLLSAVMAIDSLGHVDERFKELDPLVVLEEFADADADKKGGRADDGEGRTGAVRALARLAVRGGALDYSQRDDEDFDTAVERARANLLVTRSRIRKASVLPGTSEVEPDE